MEIPKRVDVLLNTVIEFINRKWELMQMLKVKGGLFLLKLEIHCMTGRKVYLHEMIKMVTAFCKT